MKGILELPGPGHGAKSLDFSGKPTEGVLAPFYQKEVDCQPHEGWDQSI